VAVERVRIEAHLGVEHQQLAIRFGQRVDFDHRAVERDESVIELLAEDLRLLVQVALQLEAKGERAAVVGHEAFRRVDGDRGDLFRGFVGNVLDAHAAFGGSDHGDAAGGAIDQHRQVVFLADVDAVGDVEAVDLLAGVAGLDRHQGVAQHVLCVSFDFLKALGQADAALGIGAEFLERALAATTRVDLALHHIERSGKLLGRFDGFGNGHGGDALGNGNAELGEQFLALILVNVHG